MAVKKRTSGQREYDLIEVSKMYAAGVPQCVITDKLNTMREGEYSLTKQQINYDVKTIIKRWREYSALEINELKARELVKINNLEVTYMAAWQESQTYEIVKKKGLTVLLLRDKINPMGDPRYLAGVQWCINKRCEILGLNAPKKNEHTGKDGGPISWKQFIDDDTPADTES